MRWGLVCRPRSSACTGADVGAFPTPDPSLALDGWQVYSVAVREWQGDALLLAIFAIVTIGALLVFAAAIQSIAAVVGAR